MTGSATARLLAVAVEDDDAGIVSSIGSQPSSLAHHTSTSLPRSRRLAGMLTARGSVPLSNSFGVTDGHRLHHDARAVTHDDLYDSEPQQAGHNGRDPDALSHAVPSGQRTIRAPRYGSSLPRDDGAT